MIDAGAGRSSSQIVRNIEMLGLNPANISHLILTHCHIDHIGSAPFFKKQYGTKILIHELDAEGRGKRRFSQNGGKLVRHNLSADGG